MLALFDGGVYRVAKLFIRKKKEEKEKKRNFGVLALTQLDPFFPNFLHRYYCDV